MSVLCVAVEKILTSVLNTCFYCVNFPHFYQQSVNIVNFITDKKVIHLSTGTTIYYKI